MGVQKAAETLNYYLLAEMGVPSSPVIEYGI